MKGKLRLLSLICALALCVGLIPAAVAAGEHTVWVVGDSTACDYSDKEDGALFYKRMGFGTALKKYIGGNCEVKNLAISGESSKSFLTTANYTAMTSGIKAGDILIIAFGHNDQKADAAHYTNPNGDKTTDGSFAKSLYDNYVKLAKDKSAFPVLCTPIVRRSDKNDYSGERGHNPAGTDAYPGGNYPQVIRDLGAAKSVPVVDMTTLTKEKYVEVGVNESQYFHSWSRNKAPDNTHLNAYGAHVVAQILATELKKLTAEQAGELAAAVDPDAVIPDKTALLVQNPDWTDPADDPYTPPTTQSAQCKPFVTGNATFYGTAMGDLAGAASAGNHIRETTVDGDMRIAVLNNKGKISGSADGIVMYYFPVPAGKSFTIRAKAKVASIGTSNPNQAAFGLMARDDMYIDEGKETKETLNSEYVTAGCLGDGSGVNYARHGGAKATNTGLTLAKSLAAGGSYDLEIVRSADGNYACSIDGVSKTYDYSIDVIDTQYTYIGMFCARSLDVTYSDIYLEVDGEVLCDPEGELIFDVTDWTVENGVLESITTTKTGNAEDAMGFAVVYADGKMTGIKAVRIKAGKIAVGLELNPGETAKVFVLDKGSFAPWFAAFSHTEPKPASGGGGAAPQ